MSCTRGKCSGCGKRIPHSEPDLVLRRDGTEARRFYHERCFGAAQRLTLAKPDLWFMTHRYIDGRAN
jgi:hypothetical protein